MSSILVLDDVADAGNLIKRILEKKGHDIFVFTEEEDALNHVKFSKTDLAILDLKLKKMSGIDVLEKLKSISPSIKAIILTGYPTVETARESLKLGADEYCVKPIDKEELEKKVENILRNP